MVSIAHFVVPNKFFFSINKIYRVGHKFPYIGECTMYIFWYLDYQFPEAWIGRRGLPDPPISHPLISIFGGT